jgi:putative protease
MRQAAVAALEERAGWTLAARRAARSARIASAIAMPALANVADAPPRLIVEVWREEDARAAAEAGATEIVLDPFLRHPAPPRARAMKLRDELAAKGVALRLRTPTIIRPEDRKRLAPWLATGLPLLTGHIGLLADEAAAGRDVVADYAINCFNEHTARHIFGLGAQRITPSVELTAAEIESVIAPWIGAAFDVLVYGRTEGMTIEHCVLSAAFDREPTTCRDLCVQKHPNVELTDPTGYVFPVATDSDCRNRLLHSRPIDGSEFVPRLWKSGVRGFRLLFIVPGDRVGEITAAFRSLLDACASGTAPSAAVVRDVVGSEFTRGHFERAV